MIGGPHAAQNFTKAIKYTNDVDTAIDYKENSGKGQHWQRGEDKQIEHLGGLAVPHSLEMNIVPRDRWSELFQVTVRIGTALGTSQVRKYLTAAYAKASMELGCSFLGAAPKRHPEDHLQERPPNFLQLLVLWQMVGRKTAATSTSQCVLGCENVSREGAARDV